MRWLMCFVSGAWMMSCVEASSPPVLSSEASPVDSEVASDPSTDADSLLSEEGDTGTGIANDGIEELDAVFEGETESPGDSEQDTSDSQVDPTDGTDDASIEMDVDWGEDPACPFPYGETVTIQVMEDGTPVPAYPVAHPAVATVAYVYDGTSVLKAVDEWGEVWWEVSVGKGELTGGFDANGDGWPDAGIILAESESGQSCGESGIGESRLVIVDGFSGELSEPLAATADHCQEFEEEGVLPVVTPQWNTGSVLFGENPGMLSFLQAVGTSGWFASWEEQWSLNSFVFPSTTSFWSNLSRRFGGGAVGGGTKACTPVSSRKWPPRGYR